MGGSADQRLTSAFIGRTLVKPKPAHLVKSALAATLGRRMEPKRERKACQTRIWGDRRPQEAGRGNSAPTEGYALNFEAVQSDDLAPEKRFPC